MMRAPLRRATWVSLVALAATIAWLARAAPVDREQRIYGSRSPQAATRPPAPVRPARATRPPMGRPVNVVVDARPVGSAIPYDFLGLSFEMGDLPRIARYADKGDLVTLMRALGPAIMRFGGVSADSAAAWSPDGATPPPWATTQISKRDLSGVARLAHRTGWRVVLTVNLGHYDPHAAADETRVAHALLGHSLAALEIGNEPDTYVRMRLRGDRWNFRTYMRQVAAYRAAIRVAVPGVRVAGPDASSGKPVLSWVRAEAVTEHPALLTDHYYPSSSCGYTPVLSDLLSPLTRSAETSMLKQLATIAHASGIPLRVDETNNISCHGEPGVSNTFGSALWTLDYVVRAMAAGVTGLNFHDLIKEPLAYSPLAVADRQALSTGALRANPDWYALLLARRLLGDRRVHMRVPAGNPNLTASALLSERGRLHLVLIDYDQPGAEPLRVRLRVSRRFSGGTIVRLTALSPSATSGVKLAGRSVAGNGAWRPALPLPRVYGEAGSLALSMPPSSAALVTLDPPG
jgi:hypothetical protein